MVFSDTVFVFAFLPIALAISVVFRSTRLYATILFILSITFYFWSSGNFVFLLLFSITANFIFGLLIVSKYNKFWLVSGVIVNVLIITYFKYTYFIASNLSFAFSSSTLEGLKNIMLPVGISFYTFQAISYLFDISAGKIEPERRFFTYAAYISLFPQLIAGPIVRYVDVIADLNQPRALSENFAVGAQRFTHGLFKKVLIADSVAIIADAAFSAPISEVNFATAFIGAVAYSLQIYFDFSAYFDMAIGIGLMLGLKFNENFRRPYSAVNLTDFWRRWHISLSTWFRDYVYIPLGGNRSGVYALYRNLLVVFILTGLWHGAAWTYLIWGLFHGAVLIFERVILRDRVNCEGSLNWHLFYFLPLLMFGWIIFRSESLLQMQTFIISLCSPFSIGAFTIPDVLRAGLRPFEISIMIASSLIFILPGQKGLGQTIVDARKGVFAETVLLVYFLIALFVSLTLVLSSNFSPFLYFQF